MRSLSPRHPHFLKLSLLICAFGLPWVVSAQPTYTPTPIFPLSVALGANTLGNNTLGTGPSIYYPMMQVQITNPNALPATVTSFTLFGSGTGNEATDITSTDLYLDANGDGFQDGGDMLLATTSYAYDNGAVTFNFSQVVAPASSVNLLVYYRFSTGSPVGTYQPSLQFVYGSGQNGALSFTGLPLNGALITLLAVTPTYTITGTIPPTDTPSITPTPTLTASVTVSTPNPTDTGTDTYTVTPTPTGTLPTSTPTYSPTTTPTLSTVTVISDPSSPPNSTHLPGDVVDMMQFIVNNPGPSPVTLAGLVFNDSGTGNIPAGLGSLILYGGVPEATTFTGSTATFTSGYVLWPFSGPVTFLVDADFSNTALGTYSFSLSAMTGTNGQSVYFSGLPLNGSIVTLANPTSVPTPTGTWYTPTPTNTNINTQVWTPTYSPTPTTATGTPSPQPTITFQISPSSYLGYTTDLSDPVTYLLQVNVTGAAAQGVTLGTSICAGSSFVAFTVGPAGYLAGSQINWNLGNLSAGTSQQLGYVINATNSLPYTCTTAAALTYTGGVVFSNPTTLTISPPVTMIPTFTYTAVNTNTPSYTPTDTPTGTWATSTPTYTNTITSTPTNTLTQAVTFTSTPTPVGTPVAAVSQAINPSQAAVVALGNGAVVSLPANSFAQPATLTITEYAAGSAPATATAFQLNFMGNAYTIDAGGQQPLGGVTITLPYDPAQIPAGYTAADLIMTYYDGAKWVTLAATVDTVNHLVTVVVTHFSWWAMALTDHTPTPGPIVRNNGKPLLYPNPAVSGTVHIQLNLAAASDVRVQVFSTNYRKVRDLTFPQVPAGSDITLDLVDKVNAVLGNGLYYVAVTTSRGRSILKLLVTR